MEQVHGGAVKIHNHVWSLVTTRSTQTCKICRMQKPQGTSMYRPVGNPPFRMERICMTCVNHCKNLIDNDKSLIWERKRK